MTEYAIIQSGSKQYRVNVGSIIDVELLGDQTEGDVEFSDVLLYNNGKEAKMGTPTLADARVKGEIVSQVRGPKVIAYKYKRRKNYRRKVGHRQNHLRVKIVEFSGV